MLPVTLTVDGVSTYSYSLLYEEMDTPTAQNRPEGLQVTDVKSWYGGLIGVQVIPPLSE